MIYAVLGFLVSFTAVWGVYALRRRYHDKLTAAYCEGFKDGAAYEVKAQAKQGRRAVIRTVMSLN